MTEGKKKGSAQFRCPGCCELVDRVRSVKGFKKLHCIRCADAIEGPKKNTLATGGEGGKAC